MALYYLCKLKAQVDWLLDSFKTDALLETYLPGREFSVGVVRKRFLDGYHLLPLEIVAPVNRTGSHFLSSRIKRTDSEQTFEVTDSQIRQDITTLALEVFKALGAQDYGRIDIRLDGDGDERIISMDTRGEDIPIGFSIGLIDRCHYFYEAHTKCRIRVVPCADYVDYMARDPDSLF